MVAPAVSTDRRPRVLVDADVLGRRRTGDETYVRALLHALAGDERFDLWAATTRPDEVPAGVQAVPTGGRGQAHRLLRGLRGAIRSSGADLLHANYFLPIGWSGRAVVTVHDVSFARHAEFMPAHDRVAFRTLVPRAMRRAARVLTVSEWSKADLVDRYRIDPERVVVTPNGVEDDLSPEGHVPDRPPYLLFVGSLQRRKDPETAVRALAHVDRELQLVVVGPDRGEGDRVRAVASELGLADRVHMVGYVDRPELVSLYRGAQALVFPSRYEGFGLPALEAMACGTPVVAAATTSLPEVVGDAGVLVPPGDPEALASGVSDALGRAPELIAAGMARVTRYRWADTARRTAAVYEEVLS